MGNLHTDHGVNQVLELVREWNGSFSVPPVIGLENSQQSLNRSDVTRNFPNFRRSNCIYFIFLVAACEILFRSDKELWLVWILFCDIQKNFHVISVSKMAGWKCTLMKWSEFRKTNPVFPDQLGDEYQCHEVHNGQTTSYHTHWCISCLVEKVWK